MSMGVPGGAGDPTVQARVRAATQFLSSGGKIVGTTFTDASAGRQAARAGARLLAISVGGILAQGAREVLDKMRAPEPRATLS